MKQKTFKIPLYGGSLTIISAKSLKEVEAKYNLTDTHGCDALSWKNYKKNGSALFYMAFEGEINPSNIAHEALHILAMVYDHVHAKLSIENDEPQCYLMGWIVEKCHKLFSETIKPT